MCILFQKLRELVIFLQHDVPPQHEIGNHAGTCPLTEAETKEFETYGPIKKGPFTKSEDEIIKRNWENFCKASISFS